MLDKILNIGARIIACWAIVMLMIAMAIFTYMGLDCLHHMVTGEWLFRD